MPDDMQDEMPESEALLRSMFGAPGHLWSIGTFAAFMAIESGGQAEVTREGVVLATRNGRARLRPGAELLAFETLSSDPFGWNHGIALCLSEPPASAPVPRLLQRIRDEDPVDPAKKGRSALDLGLGQGPMRALFRPDSDAAFALEGLPWSEAESRLAILPGSWIIETPILRAEQDNVSPGPVELRPEGAVLANADRAESGVRLHSIPQALESGRLHAETTPLPPGLIPVAHIFPPHPARTRPGEVMPFDLSRHQSFQAILARHGRPDLLALKQDFLAALEKAPGQDQLPPKETDRHRATVIRVALRQQVSLGNLPDRAWLKRFDPPLLRALDQQDRGR